MTKRKKRKAHGRIYMRFMPRRKRRYENATTAQLVVDAVRKIVATK